MLEIGDILVLIGEYFEYGWNWILGNLFGICIIDVIFKGIDKWCFYLYKYYKKVLKLI